MPVDTEADLLDRYEAELAASSTVEPLRPFLARTRRVVLPAAVALVLSFATTGGWQWWQGGPHISAEASSFGRVGGAVAVGETRVVSGVLNLDGGDGTITILDAQVVDSSGLTASFQLRDPALPLAGLTTPAESPNDGPPLVGATLGAGDERVIVDLVATFNQSSVVGPGTIEIRYRTGNRAEHTATIALDWCVAAVPTDTLGQFQTEVSEATAQPTSSGFRPDVVSYLNCSAT